MSELNLNKFQCQKHPGEPIRRIFLGDVSNPLMCVDCLVNFENTLEKTQMKTITSFLDEIVAASKEDSAFDVNRQNYPPELEDIMKSEDDTIERLAEHIEKEKAKVDEAYELVKEQVLMTLQKKRIELLTLLDGQLHILKQNYKRMKNKIDKFFHGENENTFSSKEDLVSKVNAFGQTYELQSFISTLLEEYLENKVIKSQGKDYVEALKENIGDAAKEIRSQTNHFPTSVLTNPVEFEKLSKIIDSEISKDLIKVTRLENPLIDIMISGGVFETVLLKDNQKMIRTLTEWIVPEKNVKFKLLWRGSRDGYGWNEFNKKAGSSKPNLILAKVKSNGHIIGGYTDQDWQPTSSYKSSSFTFIFNLTEGKKYRLKKSNKSNATYCLAGTGPTFGTGYDLYFANGMNTNTSSSSSLGNAYEGPQYQSICGQANFQVEEFEFYECEHRKLTSEDEPRFIADEVVAEPEDPANDEEEDMVAGGLFD